MADMQLGLSEVQSKARQHYQIGHDCIEGKCGVSTSWHTLGYLRQSGGQEELSVLCYIN